MDTTYHFHLIHQSGRFEDFIPSPDHDSATSRYIPSYVLDSDSAYQDASRQKIIVEMALAFRLVRSRSIAKHRRFNPSHPVPLRGLLVSISESTTPESSTGDLKLSYSPKGYTTRLPSLALSTLYPSFDLLAPPDPSGSPHQLIQKLATPTPHIRGITKPLKGSMFTKRSATNTFPSQTAGLRTTSDNMRDQSSSRRLLHALLDSVPCTRASPVDAYYCDGHVMLSLLSTSAIC